MDGWSYFGWSYMDVDLTGPHYRWILGGFQDAGMCSLDLLDELIWWFDVMVIWWWWLVMWCLLAQPLLSNSNSTAISRFVRLYFLTLFQVSWAMCSRPTTASTRTSGISGSHLRWVLVFRFHTQDLAPKNELCDEFLFTSHVIEAWPKVVRLTVRHGKMELLTELQSAGPDMAMCCEALLPLFFLKDDIMADTCLVNFGMAASNISERS